MGEQQPVDEQGNTLVLSLERKSVQPYRTQDEYLYAMKEDLAEWFNTLYNLSISVDDFFEQLETGVVICQHANRVQDFILEKLQAENASFFHARPLNVNLPEKGVQYRANVREGSFQSRDNISNFITWCRGLGIPDCLLFETDDLVMRKNERNVVLCLLELARRGAKYGMQAPLLIQLEEEIDAEIDAEKAGEEFTPPPKKTPPVQRRTIDLMSLDEMVRHIVSVCTCPDQFPIIRVAEGKYKIGESLTLIFVRILRNHVMVRIGGGWDTLENYLNRHDPCRCKPGHKGSRSVSQQAGSQVQAKRRGSAPSASLVGLELKTKTVEKAAATQEKTKITSEPSSPTRRVSLATSSPSKNMQRSLPRGRDSSTARAENATPTKQLYERRRSIPTLHKTYSSATDLSQSAEFSLPPSSAKARPSSARPSSARPSGARTSGARSNISRPSSARESSRRLSSTVPAATDVNDLRGRATDTSRGRSRDKDAVDAARQRRSRSIGAPEMRRQLNKTASTPQFNSNNAKDNSVIYIQRDGSGRHKVGPVLNGSTNNSDSTRRPNTLNSTRMNMSPSKILPNKMKGFPRSQSLDTTSPTSPSDQSGKPVFSLGPDFDDLPDPEADVEANKRMELLFEEYRKIELGLSVDLPGQVSDTTPEKDTNANPKTAAKNRKKSIGKPQGTPAMGSVSRSSSQRKPSTGAKSHSRTSSGGYAPTPSAGWRKERTPSPCPFDNGMSSGRSTPSSYGRLTSTSSDVSLDMMSLSSASDKNTTRGRFGSTSSEAASEASDISQRPKSGRSTPRSSASTPRSTPVPRSKTPTPGRQRKISASNSITPQGSPTPQRKTYSPRSKSPGSRTSTRQRTTGRVSQESLGLHSSRATPPSRSRSPSPRGGSPMLQTQVPVSRSRSPSPRLVAEQPSGIPISRSRSPSPHYSPRSSKDQHALKQSSIPVSRSRSPSPRGSPRQPLSRSTSPSPRASPLPRGRIPTARSSSPSPRQSPKRTPTAQQSPRPQRKASGIAAPAAATTKPKIDIPIVTKTCWANAPWRSSSQSSTSSSFVSCVSNIEQTGETSPEKEQPEKSSSLLSKTSFSLTAPAAGGATKPARTGNKSKLSKTGASPKTHQKTKSVDKKAEQTDATDTDGITKNEMSVKITPMIYTPGKPPQPANEETRQVQNKVAVSYDGAWDSNDNPSTPVQPQIKKPVQKQQTKKVLQDQKRNNSMVDKQDSKTESKTPQRRAGVSYPRSQSAVRSASITRMRAVNQEDSVDARMSTRGRSQSKENILDSNTGGGRRSRMDQHNAERDTKRGRLSRADAVDSGPPPPNTSLAKHHRSKSTTCLAPKTVPQLTIQVDEASVQQFQDELDKIKVKPRRDDRVGPRSRIPMPVDVKRRLQKEGGDTVGATDLKRFDSGVDINNFSPTDNSMQGEDEQNNVMTWQQPEAVEVAACTQSCDTQLDADDYF